MTISLEGERRNRGLTITELSREIGVPSETYRRAEKGLGVRPGHAKLIADFFAVKVTDIWPVESEADRHAA